MINLLKLRWRIDVLSIAFLAALAAPRWAEAVPTFAQFTEAAPGGSHFGYGDLAVGSAVFGTYDGTAIGDPIKTNFTYLSLPALPADLQGIQSATMTMTSSTNAPAVTGFGGTVGSQQINGGGTLTDVISFTRNTPAAEGNGARTNLLTVTFTAQLLGTLGGETASLTADTFTGYSVAYSSDFLGFSPQAAANFALAFTSWEFTGPLAASRFGIDQATENFLNGLAAGAGSFAGVASVSIPEPGSLVLAAFGLVALLWHARRRNA